MSLENKINRRECITKLGLAAAAATLPSTAEADIMCAPLIQNQRVHARYPNGRPMYDRRGNPIYTTIPVQVGEDCATYLQFRPVSATPQKKTQWCWAACIESLLSYHGVKVPQEIIVQRTFGGLHNEPGYPHQIVGNMNRTDTDVRGRHYSVQATHYGTINPVVMANELLRNKPMIVGSQGHATVLTGMKYQKTNMGTNIEQVTVYDPWFGAIRTYKPSEWGNMNFAAKVDVTRF